MLAVHSGVPTLYMSADSDKATFGMRVIAGTQSVTMKEAEGLLLDRDQRTLEILEDATGHIWVSFDSSPSPKDIHEEMEAFATVYGSYPELLVIDNLLDVNTGGEGDHGAQDRVLDFLKQAARRTTAAVVVLCHVTGAYTDGDERIPRSGLINKIDKRPRLILTLYRNTVNLLGVCVVKNSNGPASADGTMEVLLPVVWEKSWIGRD